MLKTKDLETNKLYNIKHYLKLDITSTMVTRQLITLHNI